MNMELRQGHVESVEKAIFHLLSYVEFQLACVQTSPISFVARGKGKKDLKKKTKEKILNNFCFTSCVISGSQRRIAPMRAVCSKGLLHGVGDPGLVGLVSFVFTLWGTQNKINFPH